MLTVLEAIQLSTAYLGKKGVESPRTNAELLLAEILKCKRLELYLSFDKPLKEDELIVYREFIRKRGLRIPLQYILGFVDFYGYKFSVDENVLIPRPETELLVEKIIEDYSEKSSVKILDIGSGSGNISIVLGNKISQSIVIGIDISEEAIRIAEKNKKALMEKNNLSFMKADVFNNDIKSLGKFDIVVSNPPYVSLKDFNDLEPELKNYEPRFSLTDESDGLSFYKKIISISKDMLNTNGRIYFEVGKDQYKFICELMLANGFSNISVTKDYAGIQRIVSGDLL